MAISHILILGLISFFCYSQTVYAKDEHYPKKGTPVVGSLKIIENAGKPPEFLHEYLFRFAEGKWSGAHHGYLDKKILNRSSTSFPYDINMQVFFDGRQLGAVVVKSDSCKATNVPAQAISKLKKYRTLITTSIDKPRDLEAWKPLKVSQAPFPEQQIHDAWMASQLCQPPKRPSGENTASKKKPGLQIEKVYAPKNKTRYLVIAKKTASCDFLQDDYSSQVWLFREASGNWTVAEGNDLLDIGDFNGDGKSEALFQGAHNPPSTYYELRDMDKFLPLISIPYGVGEGEGPCYNITGG